VSDTLEAVNTLIRQCCGHDFPKGVRNPRLDFGIMATFGFVLYGQYIAREYPETIPKLRKILDGLTE
jgi:hypothetical protein